MRKYRPLIAALALPLTACAYDSYGYDRYAYNPYAYNPIIGTVGILGAASFSQAAANACAGYAARYGDVHVTNVRQTDYDRMHVYGHVSRGYGGTEDWDCTYRSDGRITDFDL